MGAALADAWTDPRTGLRYELYAATPFRLLRKQSPVLQDGTQPWYCEPVPAECVTARGARRWQIPEPDGTVLTPEEAENAPDLVYEGWEL
jgi:hypothetical protein